ncbi:nucleotidyltransferase [Priestia megaterium]|uniref:nucleotidyltransferase domain-containing protein n=1 Tax=Priestia megaterium TaxID=1404 RepID=UPI00237AF01F|nr:nucleotidyltransferase [Priestia megaterium]MDD9791741.1 nucleotidyltransferase [Priestia megaterium]
MVTNEKKETILKTLIENLDLPDSAYEKAKKRYEDLGRWFDREECQLKSNDVHIFPQGSFMLGTATRPINPDEEYDLDLACKLRDGISKKTHTQQFIKDIIGLELELYRKARGIKEKLCSKHRCWRLEYKDDISFHLDIVPAIPADDIKKAFLYESMEKRGVESGIAKSASETAISITDDRNPDYNKISDTWNISNPEGYSIWFSSRMELNNNIVLLEKAQVDPVPLYKNKKTLQRCIQILKRHRDIMFEDNESKPISIIITTLAARAYNGEDDLSLALNNILNKMPEMINSTIPRVPNPVNPQEDFADRWAMPKYRHLNLEQNFLIWTKQVKKDLSEITSTEDTQFIRESFNKRFAVNIGDEELKKKLGVSKINTAFSRNTKEHVIADPIKPWKYEV